MKRSACAQHYFTVIYVHFFYHTVGSPNFLQAPKYAPMFSCQKIRKRKKEYQKERRILPFAQTEQPTFGA
jgi:hypothetical protein